MALDEQRETPIDLATPDSETSAPVAGTDRIGSLDFIRGLAVMGILVANIVAFGQPFAAYMYPEAFTTGHSAAEDWMWIGQFVLIDSKMRGLFTLLFGAGLYLFMEKAWAKGATRWLQVRRLFWLMLFGLAHYFLIWRGDILFSYAICGFLVLGFITMSTRVQFVIGLLGYASGALLWGGLMAMMVMAADTPQGDPGMPLSDVRSDLQSQQDQMLQDGATQTELISGGHYGDYVGHMVSQHASDLGFFIFLWLFETLPLMLIGMALYRWGFFSGAFSTRKMRLWGMLGVVAGGLITFLIGLWVRDGGFTYYGTQAAQVGFSYLPRLAMILGLAALLVTIAPSATGWLGQRISAAGRAAFTNYLGTSLVMLLVMHGWALGLFGELTRTQLYLVAFATCALMLAWSKPWLDRFRYGPLEWLWRCLTYGRVFALRRG